MSGSGLFVAKSLMPYAAQRIFIKFFEHPIAIIYKNEVLKNNRFYLRRREDSTNYEWLTTDGDKVYMWWALSLVRYIGESEEDCDTMHLNPLEFTMDEVLPTDCLVNSNDYIISEDPLDSNGINSERWNLNCRKEECRNALFNCGCRGDEVYHNMMIPYIAQQKLKDFIANILEIMESNSEDTLNGILDYTDIWHDLRYLHYVIECDDGPIDRDYYENTLETWKLKMKILTDNYNKYGKIYN